MKIPFASRRTPGPVADPGFLSDLEQIFAAPAPVPAFQAVLHATVARPAPVSRAARRPRWRPAVALGAALVLAVSAMAVPGLRGADTPTANAQEIVARAAAAAAQPAAALGDGYRVVTIANGPGWSSTTESWYGPGGQARSETRWIGAEGRTHLFGQATDGTTGWLYTDQSGTLRVAEGPAGIVAIGASPLAMVDDPGDAPVESGARLAALIAELSAGGCYEASLAGETTLLDRPVYRVVVDAAACKAGAPGSELWVDQETFMTLKLDQTGEYRYEVAAFEPLTPTADLFAYQPPAGAEVARVADLAAAKDFLSGAQ